MSAFSTVRLRFRTAVNICKTPDVFKGPYKVLEILGSSDRKKVSIADIRLMCSERPQSAPTVAPAPLHKLPYTHSGLERPRSGVGSDMPPALPTDC